MLHLFAAMALTMLKNSTNILQHHNYYSA